MTYTAFSTPSKGPFSPSKFLEINSTEHAPYSIVNYRVTLMILSPVLSIPSCPAGPFSEILEIKIPCKKRNNFATTSEKVTKYFAPKQKFNDRKYSNGWSECDQTWSSLLPRHFPYKESNLFHRQYWFQGLCCSGGSCIQSAEEEQYSRHS